MITLTHKPDKKFYLEGNEYSDKDGNKRTTKMDKLSPEELSNILELFENRVEQLKDFKNKERKDRLDHLQELCKNNQESLPDLDSPTLW